MDFLQHNLDEITARSPESKPKAIYRDIDDQLKIKKKKKVHFESNGLLQRDDETQKNSELPGNGKDDISRDFIDNPNVEKSGIIRVKVLMKREEALRLLSKCKDGGVLELKDVANQLVQIPNNRVD